MVRPPRPRGPKAAVTDRRAPSDGGRVCTSYPATCAETSAQRAKYGSAREWPRFVVVRDELVDVDAPVGLAREGVRRG